MNLKKLFLIGLVCVFLAPSSAFAEKGKWSFTPYVGANVATSRDMVEGTTVVTRTDTLSDGTILGVGGSVDLKALSFNDTHDARLLTGFDVGYFVSETLELFGGFEYVTANGDTTQLGTVVNNTFTITDTTSTTTTIAINDTIDATFDDYNSWAIKLGVTKYFPIQVFTPYIGGYAGFKHVDSMDVKLQVSTAGVASIKTKFYDSTDTGYFGVHTGINTELNMGMPVFLGVRVRADYTPELNGDDSDVSLVTNGAGTNNTGGGIDLGITAQLSIPF